MSVTVYNPTTGRYVTTLNASAGAKKQVSTAAIKSKEGGQAAPLTPVASSVKVTLSAAAKAVLSGTTKLKASELFAKMQQPGYSASDLSGITLYLDGSLKELMPPAVPGSNKLFDLGAIQDSPSKTISLTMGDMGLNPIDYKNYNGTDNPVVIQWMGQNSDGSWVPVQNAQLPTSFPANGQISIDYTNLPNQIKSFEALRADFSRVPNYEKMLNLLTAEGGRKLVDIRANNDAPVMLDVATFKKLQADMRDSTLISAGSRKLVPQTYPARITTSAPTTRTSDNKTLLLAGATGDAIVWRKRNADNSWSEITDSSWKLPSVLNPGKTGSATIDLSNVPLNTTIRAEVSTPIALNPGDDVRLFALDGTTRTEITDYPFTTDAKGQITIVPARLPALASGSSLVVESYSSALLNVVPNLTLDVPFNNKGEIDGSFTTAIAARFKQLTETNKATKVTINGETGPFALTPDDVTNLGPKVLARYPGKITINADTRALTNSENFENLRILNNYRDVAITLDPGVPASDPDLPPPPLSDANSRLSYQQFVGGFNLVNATNVKAQPVSFNGDNYDAASKTSKSRFSGLLMNGDSFQFSFKLADQSSITLNTGPLALQTGASPAQQADALVGAINGAFASARSANTSIPPAEISRVGNELSIKWGSGVTADPDFKFVGSQRVQEGVPAFGVDLFDVPPSAVETLVNYPQVTGLNVSGSNDQILNNTDKLTKLISNGFIKSVGLVASGSGTGQLLLTAAQAVRAIPILEKLIPGANAAGLVSITDKRSAPSSYSNFTDAAASRLRGGIQLSGSASEISNALKGIGALTRTGKISSVTLTGANGSQTVFDNFNAAKLSALTARLRKTG